MLASDPASLTDLDFYATRCFANSIEEIWGIPPVYQRGGGSIPIVSHMQNNPWRRKYPERFQPPRR